MRALVLLLLLVPAVLAVEECISCEEMQGTPPARILNILDSSNQTIEIIAYYENYSATPSRQYINDSIIIIHMTNATGLDQLYKTYTNAEGKAYFDFGSWKDGCANFKILYCPFCAPGSPACGFKACLDYAQINTTATSADDLVEGPGGNPVPSPINPARYLATVDQASYCPPPPSLGETPALCLPLLIIFSLLSGALYLTGRNPFAAFNIGGARIGRHIRYQARGRGFAMDLKSVALSVASAAKEMQTNPETGKKYGEETKPTYFGYSTVMRLTDVIVGTGGAGGTEGGVRTSATVTLGGGRVRRPGIAGAFRQAGRDTRAATVRGFGGRVDAQGRPVGPGSGAPAGREFGAGRVMGEWGTEFGLALGRMGAALWDSSFLSQIGGVFSRTLGSLSYAMEREVGASRRETGARAIADAELLADRYGRRIEDRGVGFREGRSVEDTDGTLTGRSGSRYVDLNLSTADREAMGLPADARAVVTVQNVGEHGESSMTVHISVGEGDNRRMTNYRMENGVVVGFEHVMNPGGIEQMGISFRIGSGGRIEAAGLVNYSGIPGAAPSVLEVRRDAEGRITEIGDIVIQRNSSGAVTGMFDRSLPTSTTGQPGMRIGDDSTTGRAVTNLMNADGTSMSNLQSMLPGMIAMNAANMREMTNRTMEQANTSLERSRTVFMDQFGLVEVTDRNVLRVNMEGERDSNGLISNDARGDYSIRVVDSTYSPSGGTTDRGLAAGTTISVSNDQYTGVRGADGREIAITTRPVSPGSDQMQTLISGSNVVLNTGYREDRGAGAVTSHMQEFSGMMANAMESYRAYQTAVTLEAGRQFRENRPELAANLEQVVADRRQMTETFEGRIREGGATDGVSRAAGLLYGSTSFAYLESNVAVESGRAEREYRTAFTEAIAGGDHRFEPGTAEHPGPDVLSPRARAYNDARDGITALGIDPDSARGRAMVEQVLRPQLREVQGRELNAIRDSLSDDPAARTRGEQAIRDLGIVPSGYRPREGESLGEAALRNYQRTEDQQMDRLIDERVRGSVSGVMSQHTELLVAPGESAGGTRVAGYMLGLGPDLAGMADSDVRARVQESVLRDPTIRPEDRDEAMRYVDTYLPRAREVAREFGQAADATVHELSQNTRSYIRSDVDMNFSQMTGERWISERPEFTSRPAPATDSDEARRYAETHPGTDLSTSGGRQAWESEWQRREEERVQTTRSFFIVDTSREWAAAEAEARRALPRDASESTIHDYAMGRLLSGYAERYASSEGATNPLALNDHQAFMGVAASGAHDPNLGGIDYLASARGSGEISAPGYERPSVTVDPMAIGGFVAGTRTVLETSAAYGHEVPPEVYRDANRGIASFNSGQYTDAPASGGGEARHGAATLFMDSSRAAERYAEERAQREMREAGDAITGTTHDTPGR